MDLAQQQDQPQQHTARRPSKANSRTLLVHLAIAALGCVCVFFLTSGMRKHAAELHAHLLSGSWEVTTDEAAVQGSLRAQYGDPRKWSILYVAGTSNSFPLQDQYRQETITDIGQSTSDNGGLLSLRYGALPEIYGDLLSDLLRQRDLPSTSISDDPIRALADFLSSRQKKNTSPPPDLFKRSRRALSRQSDTGPLVRALASYQNYSASTAYFPDFQVFTDPPYDNDDLLAVHSRSIEDKKTGKCVGQLEQVELPGSPIAANIERHPRVLEITMNRLWLSEEILDNSARTRGEISDKFFGLSGTLRDIPEKLWVLMEDDLHVSPVTASDAPTIDGWRRASNCCRVTCDGVAVTLSPTSVTPLDASDAAWSGLVAGQEPSLFAVISRHRVAP